MTAQPPGVSDVIRSLLSDPYLHLVRKWNWKSALTSALMRAGIFFTANVSAGRDAAVAAMITEFSYRVIISGFYGSVTQAFRRAEPAWAVALTTMLVLPAMNHTVEFLVHWTRGTQKLKASIIASISFTVLSTLFNLYAMRRGVMVVDEDRKSLWQDLRAMPAIIAGFLAVIPLAIWRQFQTGRD